jgi:hypothetical protein
MQYSTERKEAVLRKMVPPNNRSIKQLAREEGISEATLFNWRSKARMGARGNAMLISYNLNIFGTTFVGGKRQVDFIGYFCANLPKTGQ